MVRWFVKRIQFIHVHCVYVYTYEGISIHLLQYEPIHTHTTVAATSFFSSLIRWQEARLRMHSHRTFVGCGFLCTHTVASKRLCRTHLKHNPSDRCLRPADDCWFLYVLWVARIAEKKLTSTSERLKRGISVKEVFDFLVSICSSSRNEKKTVSHRSVYRKEKKKNKFNWTENVELGRLLLSFCRCKTRTLFVMESIPFALKSVTNWSRLAMFFCHMQISCHYMWCRWEPDDNFSFLSFSFHP